MVNVRLNSRIAAVLFVIITWSIFDFVSSQGKKKVDVAIVLDYPRPFYDCPSTFVDLMKEFRPTVFDFDARLGVFLLKESSLAMVEAFGDRFKDDGGLRQIATAAMIALRNVRLQPLNESEFEGVMRETKRKIENETTNREDAMDVIIWLVAGSAHETVRGGIGHRIKTKYAHAFFKVTSVNRAGCVYSIIGKEPPSMDVQREAAFQSSDAVKIVRSLITQQVEDEKCYTTEKWSEHCFFDDQKACRKRIRNVGVCTIEETIDTTCEYGDDFCEQLCDADKQWYGLCQADCDKNGTQRHRSQKAEDGEDPNYVHCPMREKPCFNGCNLGTTTPPNQLRNSMTKRTASTTSKPTKKSTASHGDAAALTTGEPGLEVWHYIVIALGVLAVVAIVAAVIIVIFCMKGKGSRKSRIENGRRDGASKIERSRGTTQGSSVMDPTSRGGMPNRSTSRRLRGRADDRRR